MDLDGDNAAQDEINRREHERHLYREHIENCAVFAKEMLRGAFIINGVAVTAILASSNFEKLKWAAFVFAIGAVLSLASGFYAYRYQYDIAFTFKFYVTKNEKDRINPDYDYEKNINPALILGVASLFFFCVGLIGSACSLG